MNKEEEQAAYKPNNYTLNQKLQILKNRLYAQKKDFETIS